MNIDFNTLMSLIQFTISFSNFSAQIYFSEHKLVSQCKKLFLEPNGPKMAERPWEQAVIENRNRVQWRLRNNYRIEWMNCSGTIFKRGFHTKICCFYQYVSQHRNIHAKSSSTIAWHGMKMKKYFYNLQEIRQAIVKNLNGPGCSGGYRSHWHELTLKGNQVPRL